MTRYLPLHRAQSVPQTPGLLHRVSMDFFQVGSRQAAVTNHDSTGYSNMADPVVVAHNEISGTTWCQRCQLEANALGSELVAAGDASSR